MNQVNENQNSGGVAELSPRPALAPPIPLTAPDGKVFGYACARCLHVKNAFEGGTFESRLEGSLESASTCCMCRACGKALYRSWTCPECRAAERAQWQKHLEETQPERDAQEARRDAALAKAKDENAALILRAAMSEISESYYAAGWLIGLEHVLWQMVEGGERRFGMGTVEEYEVANLKRLAEQCGGWWYFDDADGETFITTADWRQRASA